MRFRVIHRSFDEEPETVDFVEADKMSVNNGAVMFYVADELVGYVSSPDSVIKEENFTATDQKEPNDEKTW